MCSHSAATVLCTVVLFFYIFKLQTQLHVAKKLAMRDANIVYNFIVCFRLLYIHLFHQKGIDIII